jgi:hypothetical protein
LILLNKEIKKQPGAHVRALAVSITARNSSQEIIFFDFQNLGSSIAS